MYAMEESGCGPPRGMMNLVDDNGAAAFLRAVQYHLSLEFTFISRTIMKNYVTNNKIPDRIAHGKTLNDRIGRVLEHEGNDIPICKVSVNPMLIFLHVDQGCFDNLGYTSFASPFANSRSLDQDHVERVCVEVKKGNAVVSQEDFAIMPFDVCQGEESSNTGGGASIPYRCTLNRDRQSDVTVLGKKAVANTRETLDNMYHKVSLTIHALPLSYVHHDNVQAKVVELIFFILDLGHQHGTK